MRFTVLFIFIQLFASAQISLVKGPYLQIGTPGSMIVKWQTNYPTSTKCIYGTNPAFLNLSYQNSNADTVHEAYLSGLQPYKKYYYSIGSNTFVIQGDTNNYFVTSPAPGAQGNYRFWITGDCGNGSVNQAEVRNKYLLYNGNRHTDGWLLLGDNAYNDGLDAEYNSNFFSYYQNNIMKKTVLWPAIGNHDYANSLSNQNSHNVPYYSIFNLPKNGEAGGVISGTEAFYSYNYGNIHFVALDSYGHELNQYRLYDTLGPQVQWLKQDLAANTLPWVVVYFHHPPYTMGSHNSDNESELYSIRQNLVRILERYNVDFVFNGHSHSYERSKLMNGHWGNENTFNAATHHLSSSSALYNGSANSCPYIKNTHQKGTVYVVSGSAGSVGGISASFPHDAMYYSNASEGGSLIMDVRNNRCDFRWLCGDGILRDSFTVFFFFSEPRRGRTAIHRRPKGWVCRTPRTGQRGFAAATNWFAPISMCPKSCWRCRALRGAAIRLAHKSPCAGCESSTPLRPRWRRTPARWWHFDWAQCGAIPRCSIANRPTSHLGSAPAAIHLTHLCR